MQKLIEERRAKNKKGGELNYKDLLTGNLPDKVLREIYRPEKQYERHSMTKKFMKDFFQRNLSRPNKELELPGYLLPFKFPEPERFTEQLFDRLKQGKYDIKEEER